MPKIIQIEELVYGRLPHVSKTDWIAMLVENGALRDYTTFKNDYLLFEQSDYRFAEGKMISSERLVYNISYLTYDTERNAPDPENTTEKVTTRYDENTDRYFVYYIHYPLQEGNIAIEDIRSEADMPIIGIFHQAPPETKATHTTSRPVPFLNGQPKPQPQPASKSINPLKPHSSATTATNTYHKPWRQKRLARLKELYNKGYSLRQIMNEFEGCTEQGIIYQLKTHLGIQHPFQQQSNRHPDRRKWTPQELTQLISLSTQNMSYAAIAHRLNRDLDDIMDKLRRAGIID